MQQKRELWQVGGISSSGRESWPNRTFNYPELEKKKRVETGFGREKDENLGKLLVL